MGITSEQLKNSLKAQYPDKPSALKAAEDYRKVVARCKQDPAYHQLVIKTCDMPDAQKHMAVLARVLEVLY